MRLLLLVFTPFNDVSCDHFTVENKRCNVNIFICARVSLNAFNSVLFISHQTITLHCEVKTLH